MAVAFTTSAVQNQSPLTCFIEHFSSWDKLIRSAAWLLKIKENLRQLNLKEKISDLMSTDIATLDGITLASSTTVRNPGVIFDQDLSFNSHIKQTSRTAFFHLRNITKIIRSP